MPKVSARTYSRYGLEAISLLGSLVRATRKEQKMTEQELDHIDVWVVSCNSMKIRPAIIFGLIDKLWLGFIKIF